MLDIIAPKIFQRFMVCTWEIFFKHFHRFSLERSNSINLWATKLCSFGFKQVKNFAEIDWYHYQSANAAHATTVRNRKNGHILTKCHTRAHCALPQLCVKLSESFRKVKMLLNHNTSSTKYCQLITLKIITSIIFMHRCVFWTKVNKVNTC